LASLLWIKIEKLTIRNIEGKENEN